MSTESTLVPSEGQVQRVVLLGDPRLRRVSEPVAEFAHPGFQAARKDLQATLGDFRARHGFGRAMSAPQIGVAQRLIAVNLGGEAFVVVNPQVTWTSPETFTMWDYCMSFPSLLVRLRRYVSVSLRYQDERGDWHTWERLDQAAAELLQHEIDHLDGVLAVDRALDRDSLVLRDAFEAQKAHFFRQVDYVIPSYRDPA